ncbi:hypothetical protein [Haladaptatus sp. DYF46]|uniref:hypothetical protein n=2 Tax=Haladaptatus sp. DYF46 TaxID=2886041 RepID=UPI001E47855F|nr:hypothetical protein [Haladaptatus sp. DYF46]
MSNTITAERVGIIIGCIITVSLPASLITALFLSNPPLWQIAIAWILPGVIVGVFLANDALPVTYDETWSFGVLSWICTLLLWKLIQVNIGNISADQTTAVWTTIVGLVIAALITWVRPQIQRNRSAS